MFKNRSIRHYLDRPSRIELIKSHILSRTDYYNILYANANEGDKMLNAAVRFIYNLDIQNVIAPFAKDFFVISCQLS